jgi:hypothetical protein
MNFNRSTRQAFRVAAVAVLTAASVSACVQAVDYYDDSYYPEERTVIVKQARPVYQQVQVYETRPTIIVNRPVPHRHHYYVEPSRISGQVIVRPHSYHHYNDHVIIKPGRHQQQQVIVKPYSQREQVNTTVVKDYRHNTQSTYSNSRNANIAPPSTTAAGTRFQNNYETHEVSPPSNTEVKHPKKIVTESPGDAPPSTLAQ